MRRHWKSTEGKTMVWTVNRTANKVIEVALGSKEMMEAENVFMTRAEAVATHQLYCTHETKLGHACTGKIFCADCGKHFN